MSPPRSLSHCSTDLCRLVIAFHVYLGVKDFCACTWLSIRTALLAADSIGSFFFRWSSFSFHVFNLLPTSKNSWHCHLSFHFEFSSVRYSRNDWIIAAGYVVRYSLTFSSRDCNCGFFVLSSILILVVVLLVVVLSTKISSLGSTKISSLGYGSILQYLLKISALPFLYSISLEIYPAFSNDENHACIDLLLTPYNLQK